MGTQLPNRLATTPQPMGTSLTCPSPAYPRRTQVLSIHARVRGYFPHATVKASGFDAFVGDLVAASGDDNSLHLPVVTGAGWGRVGECECGCG